jgi:hypothetical protein
MTYSGDYINPDLDRSAIRAILAWGRISAKPYQITFKTPSGRIAAQTVRLESDSRISIAESAAGLAPVRKVTIFGIKDHPDLPDTDIKEGYTFFYQEDTYFVRDVIHTLGEVQGISEARR